MSCLVQNGTMMQLQSRHVQRNNGSSSMESDAAENDQDLARALAASIAGANAHAAASAGASLPCSESLHCTTPAEMEERCLLPGSWFHVQQLYVTPSWY